MAPFYDRSGESPQRLHRAFTDQQMLAVMPEVFASIAMKHGEINAQRIMAADVADERSAVFEFMEAMSCSNITSYAIPAPTFINKKRDRKGKPPIFEYRVITLELPASAARVADGVSRGDRASPRVHLRRGHIRRLTDRKIWVNAAVIGTKENGMIASDYRLTNRPSA